MLSYNSDQFYRDWRYAVDKEFVTFCGEPLVYADNGRQTWGDELMMLTFNVAPQAVCISSDGSRLAVAVNQDIYIKETTTWLTVKLLTVELSSITHIAFLPGNANVLVSNESMTTYADRNVVPIIRIWQLDETKPPKALDSLSSTNVSEAATAESDTSPELGVGLPAGPREGIEWTSPNPRTGFYMKDGDKQISGRLLGRPLTSPFSPSGKWMAYRFGGYALADKNTAWDVKVCSTDDFQHRFTLEGHTDNIPWIGWSPDESLIGTVSWDQSIRIWDAKTGKAIHIFHTDGQNWIGAFSPDSKYFAATCGTGSLHIYCLTDGSTYWTHQAGGFDQWRRALDWHPSGRWLALGTRDIGKLQFFDVQNKMLRMERTLSTAESIPDKEELRDMMGGYLELSQVQFLDQGNKITLWAHGDSSVEVYDLAQGKKWRFARGGTEDGPRAGEWRDNEGKVTSGNGFGMLTWQNSQTGVHMFASLDFDGIRIWSMD